MNIKINNFPVSWGKCNNKRVFDLWCLQCTDTYDLCLVKIIPKCHNGVRSFSSFSWRCNIFMQPISDTSVSLQCRVTRPRRKHRATWARNTIVCLWEIYQSFIFCIIVVMLLCLLGWHILVFQLSIWESISTFLLFVLMQAVLSVLSNCGTHWNKHICLLEIIVILIGQLLDLFCLHITRICYQYQCFLKFLSQGRDHPFTIL